MNYQGLKNIAKAGLVSLVLLSPARNLPYNPDTYQNQKQESYVSKRGSGPRDLFLPASVFAVLLARDRKNYIRDMFKGNCS